MKKLIISVTLLIASLVSIEAQYNVHSLYFLNEWSQRHTLNAAFAPEYGYLSLPVLGGIEFSVNSNMGISTFLYPSTDPTDSRPMLFMNQNVDATTFLNSLLPVNYFDQELNLNLLSFGFYTKRNSFWSFDIYLKEMLNVNLPKDLFKLMKSGMATSYNSFDLSALGIEQSNILQASLGYSRDITSNLRVGVNLKLLAGLSSERINYSKFDVVLADNQFSIDAVGNMTVLSNQLQVPVNSDNNFDLQNIGSGLNTSNTSPAGMGFAGDIGVTYKPIKRLTIAAGINDLGYMKWAAASIQKGEATGNVSFNGFTNVTNPDSLQKQLDQIQTDATNLINFKKVSSDGQDLMERIPYNINASAEFSIFGNDKHDISLGILWQSYNSTFNQVNDIVGAVNLKPLSWFTVSGTYEISTQDYNKYGVAINFSPSWINLYIASDYVLPRVNQQYIPIDNAKFNIALGGSFSLGKPKILRERNRANATTERMLPTKAEKGKAVVDITQIRPVNGELTRKERKILSKHGVKFDRKGKPVDTDGDGVPDYLDKCPDTPAAAAGQVDSVGCTLDTDSDGVADYLDKCPGTPASARAYVDSLGCVYDTDSDGVADYMDKCPDTPKGIKVDSVGCPLDTDGDGVPDYKDSCANTPKAAKGMVDSVGCPLDTDGDGVPDYLDLCPNTPAAAHGMVDKNGCLLDTDDDGVPDYLDKCPNTPAEARGMVDANGCPRDADGDGVPDYLDKCPQVPGDSANHGCPEIKTEVRTLFQKALQGIQFGSGNARIKQSSDLILNQIAVVLQKNPNYLVEIQGYSDNVGDSTANVVLSEKRAESVKSYLVKKGISEKRITAIGYGPVKPIASNKTAKGRAMNRRVEFVLSFESVKYE